MSTRRPAKHVYQFSNFFPLIGFATAIDGVFNAVGDVVMQNRFLNAPQSRSDGCNLCDDVDAVTVVFDHPRQTAHLSFDAAQAL